MIKTEIVNINNKQFIRTYSDSGYLIHGGNPEGNYTEALDPVEFDRMYTETNISVENNEVEASEEGEQT